MSSSYNALVSKIIRNKIFKIKVALFINDNLYYNVYILYINYKSIT
jgi:hypothetical protein